MPDFRRVRFRTDMPIPPEEEVEYTLNDGDTGSEIKVIPPPPGQEVEIMPGPATSNREDPHSVEVFIRPRGAPDWRRYIYRTEPAGPVHELAWDQGPDLGPQPAAFQGFRIVDATLADPVMQPVDGIVIDAGTVPQPPPPSPPI